MSYIQEVFFHMILMQIKFEIKKKSLTTITSMFNNVLNIFSIIDNMHIICFQFIIIITILKIQNMMWIIFTCRTNDISLILLLFCMFSIGFIFSLIKIRFEKLLFVKFVRLSLTILSHFTSHFIHVIFNLFRHFF